MTRNKDTTMKKGSISRTEDFFYTKMLPYKYKKYLFHLKKKNKQKKDLSFKKHDRFKRLSVVFAISISVTLLVLFLIILPFTIASKYSTVLHPPAKFLFLVRQNFQKYLIS